MLREKEKIKKMKNRENIIIIIMERGKKKWDRKVKKKKK